MLTVALTVTSLPQGKLTAKAEESTQKMTVVSGGDLMVDTMPEEENVVQEENLPVFQGVVTVEGKGRGTKYRIK